MLSGTVDTFCDGVVDPISVLGHYQEKDSLEGDQGEGEEGGDFVPRHVVDRYDIISAFMPYNIKHGGFPHHSRHHR